ncbi:extracellular solute-binding protein [Halorussus halobius]|uniref:extracellular solute-binding protein n=1 Tax=Halorussus halobius TaxID=1710537 RepID=UPI0010923CCA|nr:extracellular solute-binding protein [Halorussus halobius]
MSETSFVDRRSVLKATGGLGVAGLAGCLGGNDEVELTVTHYGGIWEDAMRDIGDEFESNNDGVTVQLTPYTTVAELEETVDDPTVDVALLDDFDVILGGSDLFAEIDTDIVTNYDSLYESAYLPGDVGVSQVFDAYGIAYDSEDWSGDDFQSWSALWDEQFEGEIAIQDSWIPFMVMGALAWGGDERNMEPLWERLPDLADNAAVFYEGFSQPEQLFNQGEVSVASWFGARTRALRADGLSLDFRIPEEGATQIRGAMAVTKNSENVETAQEFVNLNLDPEMQELLAEQLTQGPVNAEAELSGELAEQVTTEEELEDLYLPDWEYINGVRDEWLERWGANV